MITCPACGARNSETAEWCTLCAVRLGSAPEHVSSEAPPRAASAREPSATEAADSGVSRPDPAEPPTSATAGAGATRSGTGEPRWTCRVCGDTNPLSVNLCGTCATSIFAAHGADHERELDRERAAGRQYLPGAGYAALGDLATGAMQVAVLGLAILFAVLLFSGGKNVGGAACLLAGSVVWGVGAVDVAGRLEGRGPLLDGARLLGAALVIVVIVLVVTMGGRDA